MCGVEGEGEGCVCVCGMEGEGEGCRTSSTSQIYMKLFYL